MWDDISYPFPNFNSATVEVWEWINALIPHFYVRDNVSMLELKLIHVSKRGPCWCFELLMYFVKWISRLGFQSLNNLLTVPVAYGSYVPVSQMMDQIKLNSMKWNLTETCDYLLNNYITPDKFMYHMAIKTSTRSCQFKTCGCKDTHIWL